MATKGGWMEVVEPLQSRAELTSTGPVVELQCCPYLPSLWATTDGPVPKQHPHFSQISGTLSLIIQCEDNRSHADNVSIVTVSPPGDYFSMCHCAWLTCRNHYIYWCPPQLLWFPGDLRRVLLPPPPLCKCSQLLLLP